MDNNNMKPQRHGEAVLQPATLPKEAQLQEETKKLVVAHSETGHHHILEATKNIKVYAHNGERYIEVPELSRLWHAKTGTDVHREQQVGKGVYKINIKKEFNYLSKMMERVRD